MKRTNFESVRELSGNADCVGSRTVFYSGKVKGKSTQTGISAHIDNTFITTFVKDRVWNHSSEGVVQDETGIFILKRNEKEFSRVMLEDRELAFMIGHGT